MANYLNSNLAFDPVLNLDQDLGVEKQKELNKFRLKTCNKDNYKDIVAVLELFQSHYGQNHPLPKALTDTFWKNPETHLGGEEFISLVAEDMETKKTVAHIALAFRESDQHVEILLPAIDPEYKLSLDTIFNIFANHISEIVARKKWERLVFLCSTCDPLLQLIAQTYLSAKATAFVSSGVSCPATAHLDDHLGGSIKSPFILLSTTITGSKIIGPVYIPNSLRRFINTRARLMRVAFSFGEDDGAKNARYSKKVASDLKRGVRERYLQYSNRELYGIAILDCYPSESDRLNNSLVKVIARLKRKSKNRITLRVCLSSHLAPQFIQLTKELGYLPSGIDIKSNRLFLILSELDKESMYSAPLFSREAKTLREDILSRRWI